MHTMFVCVCTGLSVCMCVCECVWQSMHCFYWFNNNGACATVGSAQASPTYCKATFDNQLISQCKKKKNTTDITLINTNTMATAALAAAGAAVALKDRLR